MPSMFASICAPSPLMGGKKRSASEARLQQASQEAGNSGLSYAAKACYGSLPHTKAIHYGGDTCAQGRPQGTLRLGDGCLLPT